MRRPLIIAAAVVLAMYAIHGHQSQASAQTATTRAAVAMPLHETLTARHTLPGAAAARRRTAWDLEPNGLFRVHDRHWAWLFPRRRWRPSDPILSSAATGGRIRCFGVTDGTDSSSPPGEPQAAPSMPHIV